MKGKISPEVLEVVNRVAYELGVHNFHVNLKPGNSKGDGYMGEIIFINIEDITSDKVTEIVIKKAFSTDNLRATVPVSVCFINEINFYTNVWTTFDKFQSEFKIKNKFNKIPKCFATSSSERFEMMALENLNSIGFEVHSKYKIVDDDHTKLIFQQYGKFHALSFAYRHHYPEKYKRLIDTILDVNEDFSKSKTFINVMNGICRKALNCLDQETDVEMIHNFKKYVDNSRDQFIECMTYQGKYPAILHGDCWSNNMMFKYDDFRNVVDIRFIDFQVCRIGSPVFDLSYSFYSGADKKMFDKLDEYLEAYHGSFAKFLRDFGCDADAEFPLSGLKEDWKKCAKYGMLLALMVIKTKVTKQEDIVDIQDMADGSDSGDMMVNAECDEELLYKRYRELLVHLHERNCL